MDPVLSRVSVIVLLAVFGSGAVHKVANFRHFQQTMTDYRLLPAWVPAELNALMAASICGAEWMVCILLLFPGSVHTGALLAITLLLAYMAGIGINLLRGRTHIDCGCTWGSRPSTISGWLLVRNLVLICLAGMVLIDPGNRVTGWQDRGLVLLAGAASVLTYFSSETLIANWSRLRDLRST